MWGLTKDHVYGQRCHLPWLTTKKVDFIVDYLHEYEAICKQVLTRVSGAQVELFYEKKTRGRKFRDRVPLRGADKMRNKIIGE
jgi:hypothetical protein